MTDDPWAAFRVQQADPWAAFRTPGTPAGEAVSVPSRGVAAAQGASAEVGDIPPTEGEDQYRAAARQALKGAGQGGGLPRRILQGATLNAADEILAGATTPFEMIRHGTFDPREGYKYAKAIQDLDLERGRQRQGALGTAAEIGGGVLSGSTLAKGGVTAARWLGPNAGLFKRSLASGADAAAFGTVAGALEGNTLAERGGNAVTGGAIGGTVGGATPAVLKLGGMALSPVISNIRAQANPTGYGQSQVARALMEQGKTPRQIADEVALAAREGQPEFMLADALGNPGQRMLSTVTRSPGQGRTDAVELLEQRQAGQARRVANTLGEGFQAPETAAQLQARLEASRKAAADRDYGAARQGAGPVDVSGTIARIDQTTRPGVMGMARPGSGIADDSVEAALNRVRARLTDGRSNLTEFEAVQRARGDLGDMIEVAVRKGENNKVRLLTEVQKELDVAMENAAPGYKAANAAFARRSRTIEAIDTGKTASQRGRIEDTIPAFRNMTPPQQAAYRTGYVDPLIASAQGAPVGTNAARPLTSEAFQFESAAMAPMTSGPLMARRLGRENTMFETRRQASGGSQTAENFADNAAMGVDPTFWANLATGNWGGAARSALQAGSNVLTGNTPAVRQEVGRILTMRGGNVAPQEIEQITQQAIERIRRNQLIAAMLGRGASGGLAVTPSAARQKP